VEIDVKKTRLTPGFVLILVKRLKKVEGVLAKYIVNKMGSYLTVFPFNYTEDRCSKCFISSSAGIINTSRRKASESADLETVY